MDEKINMVINTLKLTTRDNEGVVIEPLGLDVMSDFGSLFKARSHRAFGIGRWGVASRACLISKEGY